MCVLLIKCLVGRFNRFIHISWVAVVTQTDRPKSVRNRCFIKSFVAFMCCHLRFLNFLLVSGIFVK